MCLRSYYSMCVFAAITACKDVVVSHSIFKSNTTSALDLQCIGCIVLKKYLAYRWLSYFLFIF